jgi:hypothetical protein
MRGLDRAVHGEVDSPHPGMRRERPEYAHPGVDANLKPTRVPIGTQRLVARHAVVDNRPGRTGDGALKPGRADRRDRPRSFLIGWD